MATAKSTTNEGASAKQTKPKKKPGRKSTKVKLPEGLIPIEEETWLLAPLTLTLMRHNYTSVQNKVLMSILECLQNILRQMLNAGNGVSSLATVQRGEIANEKGGLSFNLDFRSFGIDRNHYNELRSSLKMLPAIPVEIPFKSKEGKRYRKVTSLCDVFIPEEKYKTARAGYCDCYFTYEKKYTGYKKAGEPDQIEFRIYKSPKLVNNEDQAVFDRQYEQLQNMIMKHFGFTQREIESLMKRINEQNIQEMITKVSTIYMMVHDDKKGEIKDIKAYVYKAMDNFLNETMDTYEEIKD